MKLIEIQNGSDSRINITQVGLRLNPGQTTRVHPSLVEHPAVSPYMGNGLEEVPETSKTKEEPIAPVKETPAPPSTSDQTEDEDEEDEEEEEEETDETTLRDAFIEAPGITDANVDDIMGVYPTFEDLADAAKEDLIELGVAKSYAKKLLDWIAEQ